MHETGRGQDAKGHPSPFLTVAQHLCQIGQFTVQLGRQQVPLRVSPYVSGEIQNAEVRNRWGRGSGYLTNTCLGRVRAPKPHWPTYTAASLGF